MNKVFLLGRLTAKPDLKYTPQNTAYIRFSIAVNRNFTNADGKREADFINIVAWKKQAETISKYFDKGNQIAIEGRLQTGSYTDKDGSKRNTLDVILENFDFVETKTRNSEEVETPKTETKEEGDPFAEFGDSIEVDDNYLE